MESGAACPSSDPAAGTPWATELETCAKRPRVSGKEDEEDEDSESPAQSEYFDSYDDLSVHILMLEDRPRVDAYAAALRNCSLEGKTVLDVGAGSGVLSLLAAKLGGAARVYAVEAAPGMARLARSLVERNGLGSVVQVIEGRVEDVELPEKVDVIVSEWMGVYLLHESMLESVLVARKRWLKPDGLLLPSGARIWAAPVEAEELRSTILGFNDIHGLDLSPMGTAALEHRCSQPQLELVAPARLLASPALAVDLGNLSELEPGATKEFGADLDFVAIRSGNVAAIAIWFDVSFRDRHGDGEGSGASTPLQLSTGPGAPSTHWKQTVIYLGQFVPVAAGDRLPLRLSLKQGVDNPRHYDISVVT